MTLQCSASHYIAYLYIYTDNISWYHIIYIYTYCIYIYTYCIMYIYICTYSIYIYILCIQNVYTVYIIYRYTYIYIVIVSEGFSWDGHVSVALREALLIWTSRLNISCGLQWNSTICRMQICLTTASHQSKSGYHFRQPLWCLHANLWCFTLERIITFIALLAFRPHFKSDKSLESSYVIFPGK